MERNTSVVAVLFADIVGSTSLYHRMGDDMARDRVAYTISEMERFVAEFDGYVIKTIGDEIMCAFDSAVSAVNCASEMEAAAEKAKLLDIQSVKEIFLPVKAGIHYGEVIHEDGDLYGDTVNVAARMVGLSGKNEIIVTREVVEALPTEMRLRVRYLNKNYIKGKDERLDIYQIFSETEDTSSMTVVGGNNQGNTQVQIKLELLADGRTYVLDSKNSMIQIGRNPDCGIIVNDGEVSRYHVVIEMRGDSFVLTDKSVNGTYVAMASGERFMLRRNECRLVDSGDISLGSEPFHILYNLNQV